MGFETCGPNEVMVVSGCGYSRPRYIPGGSIFVWPKLQKMQKLSLSLIPLTIQTLDVRTKTGVIVSLKCTAQVKVHGDNVHMVEAASENFLGKTEEEIGYIVQQTLEGHQRTIVSGMAPDEIYLDPKKFTRSYYNEAASDLVNMGIQLVSFTLKDMWDSQGFLKAVGQQRAQENKYKREQGEPLM